MKVLTKSKSLQTLSIQGNYLKKIKSNIKKLNFLKKIEIDGNCFNDSDILKLKKWLNKTEIKNDFNC